MAYENRYMKLLRTFFEEKQLDEQTYSIPWGNLLHNVDTSFMVDLIVNHTPGDEQLTIWHIISKLDYQNGDIHDFLKFLAKLYVQKTDPVKPGQEVTVNVLKEWDVPEDAIFIVLEVESNGEMVLQLKGGSERAYKANTTMILSVKDAGSKEDQS